MKSFMPRSLMRLTACALVFCLLGEQPGFCQGIGLIPLSLPLTSGAAGGNEKSGREYLRYISYSPSRSSFITLIDTGGDEKADTPAGGIDEKVSGLMKFFFTGISLPNSVFWVNLRPGGENMVMDDALAGTDVGRIFLEADCALKKDFSLATSPFTPCGKEYWDRLRRKAAELWGTEQADISTLTRPWIMPGEIIIRETAGSLYIYKAALKVMLEQDCLRGAHDGYNDPRDKALNEYAASLLRTLIMPGLTRRVNTDKSYNELRQVYYSLILAQWFKKSHACPYADNPRYLASKKTWSRKAYFDVYMRSFQRGEYDFQETASGSSGETMRRYVSGGMDFCGILAEEGVSSGQVKVIEGNPFNRLVVSPALKRVEMTVGPDLEKGFAVSITGGDITRANPRAGIAVKRADDGGWQQAAVSSAVIAGAILAVTAATVLVSATPAFWLGMFIPAVLPLLPLALVPQLVSWMAKKSQTINEHRFLVTVELLLAGILLISCLHWSGLALLAPAGWFWHNAAEVWLNGSQALPGMGVFLKATSAGLMGINALLFQKGDDTFSRSLKVPAIKAVAGIGGLGMILLVLMNFTVFPGLLAVPYLMEIFAVASAASLIVPPILEKLPSKQTVVQEPAVKTDTENMTEKEKESEPEPGIADPVEHSPYSLLELWEKELAQQDALFKSDRLPVILNIAKHLINFTVLSKETVSQKNKIEEAYGLVRHFSELSLKTATMLEEEWRTDGLTPDEKERIVRNIRYLLDAAQYALEFEHALHMAAITTAMSNYYLPSSEWSERFKVMPGVRLLWGMSYSLRRSEHRFFRQFDKVSVLGNSIERNLYIHDDQKKAEILAYFKTLYVDKTKENLFKVQQEFSGKREMSSRFFPLVFGLWPFISGLLFVFGLPLGIALNPVSIIAGLVTGLGMSIGLSWWHIRTSFMDDFYDAHIEEYRQIKADFERTASSVGIATPATSREGMVRKGWASARAAFSREKNAPGPSADVIFVLTGKEEDNKKRMEVLFGGELSGYIRNDVPVIFVPSKGTASGDALLDFYDYMRSDAFKQVREGHPRLKDIPLERLRSIVFLAALKDGVDKSVARFSLMNAYKGSQELQRQGRRGEVVLFADGLYMGEIKPKGDITLLGSWMSQKQIEQQRFGLLLADIRGNNHIWKLYEKMDFSTIRNKLELASLRRYFDWDNTEKEQFLGFSGIMVFSFQDEDRYTSFMETMKTARECVASSTASFPVHLTLDIIIPLIMIANNEKLFTYCGAVHDKNNGKDVTDEERNFYHRLYETYIDAYNKDKQWFKLRANIPVPGEACYVRADGSEFQKTRLAELKAILDREPLPAPRIAGAATDGGGAALLRGEAPGGIDLRSLSFGENRGSEETGVPEIVGWEQAGQDKPFRRLAVLLRCSVVPSTVAVREYIESLPAGASGKRYAKASFCISEILRLEEKKAVEETDPEWIRILKTAEQGSNYER